MYTNLAKQFIPNRTVTIRTRDVPWYNIRLRCLKRKKDRSHRDAKHLNTPTKWQIFRNMRNKYITELRKAKSEYISDLATKLSSQGQIPPKSWWNLAKHFLGERATQCLPSIVVNNEVLSDPKDQCTAFNLYFSEISCVDATAVRLPSLVMRTEARLSHVRATEDEVLQILKNLDPNKDEISPRLLKLTANSIGPSLTKLINLSLASYHVPSLWKQANVCPIFKGVDNTLLTNYRPISLISSVGKMPNALLLIV